MENKAIFLLSRYILAIALCFSLPIFYLLLKPLTIYPVFGISSLLYKTSLQGIFLYVNGISIEFVDACIAGSAYLLLAILNLLTPMPAKKRIYFLISGFLFMLVFNIARIIILLILIVNNSAAFDITHKFFWYFLSTLFVVFAWFINVIILNTKSIPVYSDIKQIISRIKK